MTNVLLPSKFLSLLCFASFLFHLSSASLNKNVTKTELKSLIKDEPAVLVAFTSPSQHPFNTDFALAAESIDTQLVTVDCQYEKALCAEYDVNAHPAIRLFAKYDGKQPAKRGIRYRGPRDVEALQTYAKRATNPPLTDLTTWADLEAFKHSDDIVLVAYTDPSSPLLSQTFDDLALSHHLEYSFGIVEGTNAAELAQGNNVNPPVIACYKNHVDGDNMMMNGPFDGENLEWFLEMVGREYVEEVSGRSMDGFLTSGKLTPYLFYASPSQRRHLLRIMTPLAKKYAQYVRFGLLDATEYAPMARNMGLTGDAFPAMVVHYAVNDQVFPLKQGTVIGVETVEAMLGGILRGEVEAGLVYDGEGWVEGEREGQDERSGHDEL